LWNANALTNRKVSYKKVKHRLYNQAEDFFEDLNQIFNGART